jgi:hypothetical protein
VEEDGLYREAAFDTEPLEKLQKMDVDSEEFEKEVNELV